MERRKRDIFNPRVWQRIIATSASFALLVATTAHAIILFRTADPNANTAAPTNDPAGSGWNYEGQFGGFLGTPIAPHFFLSAAHIGDASNTLVYGGVTYTVAGHFNDPFSDLNMWQINETFPSFSPLYTKDNERGLRLVAIGRGTQRGSEVMLNGRLRGWFWGAGDGRQRWGENLVSDIVTFSSGPDDGLYATFDQNGLTDECHFSSGDSGGAVFIQDEGGWKLAGINYAVDGHFYTDASGNGQFDAAMFDAGGFYESDGASPPNYVQVPANTPTGLYATRISSKLAWIYYVTDPTGDADGDGISNLLNYARTLNDPVPRGYGSPVLSKNGSSLTFTYRKINNAPGLTYQVQQSSDLSDPMNWTSASTQDQVTSTRVNIDTVAATVNAGSADHLFLRLKITQP